MIGRSHLGAALTILVLGCAVLGCGAPSSPEPSEPSEPARPSRPAEPNASPTSCATDGECRLETRDPCQCVVLHASEPPEPPAQAQCFADPCRSNAAVCDSGTHRCALRQRAPIEPG